MNLIKKSIFFGVFGLKFRRFGKKHGVEVKKMEINQENKLKRNLKKIGGVALVGVCAVAVALIIAFSVANNVEPVATTPIEFGLPMNNAEILKDYSDSRLQHVEGAKKYEIHLAVDLASEDNSVMSICDGIVTEIDSDSKQGTVVKIEHADGFVSVYGSLDQNLTVKEGDVVKKGQKIGDASKSAGYESGLKRDHLHLTLFKNGMEVDPNNYLDLQNK